MTVDFELNGQKFVALNGGPAFIFNPAISFIVNCSTETEVDTLWEQLSDSGEVLMPLHTYPFSDRYGWVQDKYGVSWQLILADPDGEWRPKFTPSILFVGDNCGNAEEAIDFYTIIFTDTSIGQIARYGPGHDPDEERTIMYADFQLEVTGSRRRTAHRPTISPLMRRSRSSPTARHSRKSIITGRTSPQTVGRKANAAGSRTNTVSPGRSSPPFYPRCCRTRTLRKRTE